jgi:catechol 2,3-dioxygenase-like lactoylglutathione lyase family enzyme
MAAHGQALASAPEEALLLEHVNLNIPHNLLGLARQFYIEVLGGALNPRSTNERQIHINVGASQLHLPHRLSVRADEPCVAPQVWSGAITLWTSEPLDEIHRRVEALHARETAGGDEANLRLWARPTLFTPASGTPRLLCTCPWGNNYDIVRAPVDFAPAGQHAGGSLGLVAMPRVAHHVPKGAAARLKSFWAEILNCAAHLDEAPVSGGVLGQVSSAVRCTVRFASGQELVFVEAEDAPPANAYDSDEAAGYHLALYLPTHAAFEAAFRRVEAAGLLFENVRFAGGPIEFASAMTWEEADEAAQFRIKDLGQGDGDRSDMEARGSEDAEALEGETTPTAAGKADEAAQFSIKDLGQSMQARSGDDAVKLEREARPTTARGEGGAALVLELEVRSPSHVCCPLHSEAVAARRERDTRRRERGQSIEPTPGA